MANPSPASSLPDPLPSYAEPVPWQAPFPVGNASVHLCATLTGSPLQGGAPQDLDLELVSPSQRSYRNANGTLQAPDVPAILNGRNRLFVI